MANKIAGTSAGKGKSSSKGSARRKGPAKGTTRRTKRKARAGGPRTQKGWSGPVPGKQMRGSNTMSPSRQPAAPKKEAKKKGDGKQARASAETRTSERRAPAGTPRKRTTAKQARATKETEPTEEERSYAPQVAADGDLHGPDKMEEFKSTADKMVVGERTVIHHAARYGIVRGMTWTVILSALLFWLPVAGAAIAGYVGGRKAGGPFRAVIAVLIPALVMFTVLAAVNENIDLVPSAVVTGVETDIENMAGLPSQALPLLGGIQQGLDAWVATPPDVVFIMIVFAIVGGALSSLRRREEETVIEKVGIPLGELKERVLKEEAEKDGTPALEPPSRWHPHRVFAGTAAAHDQVNEMVDDIALRVYQYMQFNEMVDETGAVVAKPKRRKRAKGTISTGDESIHYDDMVMVTEVPEDVVAQPRTRGGRSKKGTTAAYTIVPRTAGEAIVGGKEDWVVVNTDKGRRPVRVVHSPMVAVARERTITETEEDELPPVVYEEPPSLQLAEPVMHVETERRGLFRRSKQKVVYSAPEPTMAPDQPTEYYVPPHSPHGDMAAGEEPLEVPAPTRMPSHRNYERLPIVGAIMDTIGEDAEGEVRYGTIRSLDEPTVHDTFEAGSIAESAARELAEMARFEEGPDLEEEDLFSPEAKAKPKARAKPRAKRKARAAPEVEILEEDMGDFQEDGPTEDVLPEVDALPVTQPPKKVKSTARKVKHPTGSLKSGGKRKHHPKVQEEVYDEDMAEEGAVEWEAPSLIEEEDMFNPRHLKDDVPEPEGHEEGSEAWAEEERIAALVREREEWDRL